MRDDSYPLPANGLAANMEPQDLFGSEQRDGRPAVAQEVAQAFPVARLATFGPVVTVPGTDDQPADHYESE